MNIKKTNDEIISIRKSTSETFEITNSQGGIMEIERKSWFMEDEYETDGDTDYLLNGQIISCESEAEKEVNNFLKDDDKTWEELWEDLQDIK